jgi:hypothetical protein
MRPVLHLEPVLLPAATIRPVAMLTAQALQTHAAGSAEQVWPDLAALAIHNQNSDAKPDFQSGLSRDDG